MATLAVIVDTKHPPLFDLGRLVATPAAIESVPAVDITEGLARHLNGDWGDLDMEDQRANKRALETGGRILSAYTSKSGVKFWISTCAERFVTTVLLPEDY
jgi:hypothetical protein